MKTQSASCGVVLSLMLIANAFAADDNQKLHDKLNKTTLSVKYKRILFKQAVEELSRALGVPVTLSTTLDNKANEPVFMWLDDAPAYAVLRWMRDTMELQFSLRGDGIVLDQRDTRSDAVERMYDIKLHCHVFKEPPPPGVRGVYVSIMSNFSPETLANYLQMETSREWNKELGWVAEKKDETTLRVVNAPWVQDNAAAFLDFIASTVRSRPGDVLVQPLDAWRTELERKLQKRVTVKFQKTRLPEALLQLHAAAAIPFVMHPDLQRFNSEQMTTEIDLVATAKPAGKVLGELLATVKARACAIDHAMYIGPLDEERVGRYWKAYSIPLKWPELADQNLRQSLPALDKSAMMGGEIGDFKIQGARVILLYDTSEMHETVGKAILQVLRTLR
jgi:hypothetical protein